MLEFRLLTFFMIIIPEVFGSQQLVVVISPEMNGTTAVMKRYEKEAGIYKAVSESVPVILGRSGLGWDKDREPLKREGDGRSPAGVYDISATFGEDVHPNSSMPYWFADDKLICIDDVNHSKYNTMAHLEEANVPKSYELMRREDSVYHNGAVIDYNRERVSGRGSCIFFHLSYPDKRPTSGCTAMAEQPLLEMIHWFDPNKKPKLLQIPRNECEKYQKEFVGIECK
ncbi:MAG: hypothetical protein WC680_08485 [Sulfuricurvum sp.]|jgi:D-alanyl-D-alanine dipeptidase